MSTPPILTWRDDAVAHISFNRPAALNAIDQYLAYSFKGACEELVNDPTVRAVVVSGQGRAFMAGGDLVAMRRDPVRVASDLIECMHAAIGTLANLPAPVIASVHGVVAGGGLGVALACDLCIAAEGTRFSVAYPLVGASPDCGTSWSLARTLGLKPALQFALLGEAVSTAEAYRLGMVNQVVLADDLVDETKRLAGKLAAGPTAAFGRTKRLLRRASDTSLMSHLDAEKFAFLESAASSDFQEGVAAFLDKRPTRFLGR